MRNVSVKPATYAMDGFISENLNIGDSTKKYIMGMLINSDVFKS